MAITISTREALASRVRREAGWAVRFCLVGIANTAITLVAYLALTAAGAPAPAASALAFCAGALNSFQLNRRWTFADVPAASGAWVRFGLIQGVGALLSAGGVAGLQAVGWGHLLAECGVVPGVTATLYALARLLVFRSR